MKRAVLFFLLLAVWNTGCSQQQTRQLPKLPSGNLNFMVASDMGRRGESQQKNIADIMGSFAWQNRVDFMAVAGDPIHDDGVKSVTDPEWKAKIEDVYTAPSLYTIPWYLVPGNHEYRGSVQAILDYSAVSSRWKAPARYYSFERRIGDGRDSCLFVMIDTTPLIDNCRANAEYSDAGEQDMERQLRWLDSVLVSSHDRWKIVIGHHPVYAYSEKGEDERADMQARVGAILERDEADFYICGHIHNFQYIKPDGCKVNYVVNSSASESHPAKAIAGTLFCNSDPGFTALTVSADSVRFFFINYTGETVYKQTIGK